MGDMSFLNTIIGLSAICFVAAIPTQVPTKETCAQRPNEILATYKRDVLIPDTCENYKKDFVRGVTFQMTYSPFCFCKEGYARLPSGECVPFDDPECEALWKPSEEQCLFRGNEIYRWGTACQTFCEEHLFGTTRICTDQLVEDCYCPEGMVRYIEDGLCVYPEDCPKNWDR